MIRSLRPPSALVTVFLLAGACGDGGAETTTGAGGRAGLGGSAGGTAGAGGLAGGGESGNTAGAGGTGGVGGTKLVEHEGQIDFIAIDAQNVYYTVCGGSFGLVNKVPIAGGFPTRMASLTGCPSDLAVDADSLYFVAEGAVLKLATSVSSPTVPTALTKLPALEIVRRVVVGPDHLYWVNSATRAIMELAKAGGTPVPIYPGESNPYVNFDIVRDGTDLFWTATTDTDNTGKLRKVSVTDQVVSDLAPGLGGRSHVVVAGANVVFSTAVVGVSWQWFMRKVARTGGVVEDLVRPDEEITALAADGASLYFTTYGQVAKLVWGAALPTVLERTQSNSDLDLDDANLYWSLRNSPGHSPVDQGGGMVIRLMR